MAVYSCTVVMFLKLELWNIASMELGKQFVMATITTGATKQVLLCVDNWDYLLQVSILKP